MAWPKSTDYIEAIQNLQRSLSDPELQAGELTKTHLDLPMAWTGNFADVYQVHNAATGNTWALKCFTREVAGQADRYRHISNHLQRTKLPFMLEFKYLEQGIRVRGQWYPALKMRWVDGGIPLNEFVHRSLDRPHILQELLLGWRKMARRLRRAKIAHADLQHGNVLLVPQSHRSLVVRLIDYDGMHVPALEGTPSTELGHPAFQHPQRSRNDVSSAEVDRFSNLAIYTAIHCLTLARHKLWNQYNNQENLLFREKDYHDPASSPVFHTLWTLPDAESTALAGRLALACTKPLHETPLLEDLINGRVAPLTTDENNAITSLLGSNAPVMPVATLEPIRGVSEDSQLDALLAAAELPPAEPMAPALRDAIRERAKPAPERIDWDAVTLVDLPFLFDRFLAKLSGEDNVALHNFFRIICALALLTAVSLPVYGISCMIASSSVHPESAEDANDDSTPVEVVADENAAPWKPVFRLSELPDEMTNPVGMKFRLIPAGEFMMGSRTSDPDKSIDELPQHPVRISEPFYLGVYEVTQDQYTKVMGTNPSKTINSDHPVEQVTWQEATAFCTSLSKLDPRFDYRLPTEAEWEYACRAGTRTRYTDGVDPHLAGIWLDNKVHPVGKRSQNDWQLHDMNGNVWEWCQDVYSPDYYSNSRHEDPAGPTDGRERVTRGGSLLAYPHCCRSADRRAVKPSERDSRCGFRVAFVPLVSTEPSQAVAASAEATPDPFATPQKQPVQDPYAEPVPESPRSFEAGYGPALEPMLGLEPAPEPEPQPMPEPEPAREPIQLPEKHVNSKGMQFKRVAPGEFMMGSPANDPDSERGETPRHPVRITRPFCLGIHEVTQQQYEAVMGENPSLKREALRPVNNVSWEDATAFCERLSKSDDRFDYRLPTEAEWEYACRAGTTTRFSCGDELEYRFAWHKPNGERETHYVGTSQTNPWGFYDMHGNVSEWCSDRWNGDYASNAPQTDPAGSAIGTMRVYRGGSYGSDAKHCRSASRGHYKPDYQGASIGFRVVMVSKRQLAVTANSPTGDATTTENVFRPKTLENRYDMKFRLIPAGEFMMGSVAETDDRSKQGVNVSPFSSSTNARKRKSRVKEDETPQHRVRITEPFYMGVHEVTQQQFGRVMLRRPIGELTQPVYDVSWNDATEFCRKLSQTDKNFDYRLPTEAEWEYACRAGTATEFSCGDYLTFEYAWFDRDRKEDTPKVVGQTHPNAWGLYDMHGNVSEWCQDYYDSTYYAQSPRNNPLGLRGGSAHVLRGGCMLDDDEDCRSSCRTSAVLPDDNRNAADRMATRNRVRTQRKTVYYKYVGFRCVLVPEE